MFSLQRGARPLPTSAAHGMRDTWLCGPSSVKGNVTLNSLCLVPHSGP